MTQTAADELGGIPMSPALQATLLRAREYASGQGQPEVSLEHLLLALSEDEDAAAVMQSCQVDLGRLRNDIAGFLGSQGEAGPPGRTPAISAGLTQILKYATLAAKQGRRPRIDGAIVLAAIVGDGKSMAASFLKAQGLTFQAAVRVLQEAMRENRAPAAAPPVAPVAPVAQPQTQPQLHVPQAPSQHPMPPPSPSMPAPSMPGSPPFHAEPPPSRMPAPQPVAARRPADAEDILAAARARVTSRLPPSTLPYPDEAYEEAPDGTPDEAAGPAGAQEPAYSNGPPPGVAPPARVNGTGPPLAAAPPEPPAMSLPGESAPSGAPAGSPPAPTWQPPPLPATATANAPPPLIRPPLSPLAPHARGPAPHGPPPFQPSSPLAGPPPHAPPPPTGPVPPPWSGQPDPRTGPPPGLPSGIPAQAPWAGAPPPPRGEPAAVPAGPRAPAIESTQLSHSIPGRMTVGKPATVEVTILRPPLGTAGGPSRQAPERRDVVTARAISVRLRPAKGRFVIDQPSAETQWDKAIDGPRLQGEAAVWRFTIVPQTQGPAELVLMVGARTVAADGMIVETTLPDQVVGIRVTRDWRRTIHTAAMLTLIGLASVVVGQLIDDLPGFDVIKRLRGLVGL